MIKKLFAASVILLAIFSISFAGSVPDIQEGEWEITKIMTIQAMGMALPSKKYTQCLTKKNLIPYKSQSGEECKISQTKVTGNTVTWTMQCSGGHGGDMKGTGEIIYSGSSVKGKVELKGAQPNSGMISQLSGKRIGDCK
jgi:hypothetical protein